MDQPPQNPVTVDPPRGLFTAKLDDKGRLKLPAAIQTYLNGLPEKSLFVTSLDRRIAILYTLPIWREIERYLREHAGEDAAENVAFNAAELGSDADVDGQGRVSFSAELRKELGIDNQTVHLQFFGRGIQILSESIFQERRTMAMKSPATDLKQLQRNGLPL